MLRLEHARKNTVRAMMCDGDPYPTNLHPSDHHCLTPVLTCTQCNLVTLGRRLPLQLAAVGNQVPDVVLPHYKDARMQHSQSR